MIKIIREMSEPTENQVYPTGKSAENCEKFREIPEIPAISDLFAPLRLRVFAFHPKASAISRISISLAEKALPFQLFHFVPLCYAKNLTSRFYATKTHLR
jgi:hypothetical protein